MKCQTCNHIKGSHVIGKGNSKYHGQCQVMGCHCQKFILKIKIGKIKRWQ